MPGEHEAFDLGKQSLRACDVESGPVGNQHSGGETDEDDHTCGGGPPIRRGGRAGPRLCLQLPQLGTHLPRCLESVAWPASQHPSQQCVDLGGHLMHLGGERRRGLGQDRGDRRERRRPFERVRPAEHLEENDPEGEEVGPRVDLAAFDLLRGHVGERPGRGAGLGERSDSTQVSLVAVSKGQLGESEVHHFGVPTRGHHDVGRLQISVHDAAFVSLGERFGDLLGESQRFGQRQRALAQHVAQGASIDVLHRDERHTVVFAHFVNVAKKRVIDRSCRQRLTTKTLTGDPVLTHRGRQELERDPAVQFGVVRQVDDPHPTLSELLEDVVVRHRLADFVHDTPCNRQSGFKVRLSHERRQASDRRWCMAPN